LCRVSRMTARAYCYTAYVKPALQIKTDTDTVKVLYHVFGIEICPTTKREHYQGYIEFSSPVRISRVKKFFNDNTIHLEKRKGTSLQAINYCKKDGNYFETEPRIRKNSITLGTDTDRINVTERCMNATPFKLYCSKCTRIYYVSILWIISGTRTSFENCDQHKGFEEVQHPPGNLAAYLGII